MSHKILTPQQKHSTVPALLATQRPQRPPPASHLPPTPPASHAVQRLVQWAQAALSLTLGLRLAVDGVLGATTAAALRRFQRQAGLAESGRLDAATRTALAEACGHPPPEGTAVAPGMPRWFRQERLPPREALPAGKPLAEVTAAPVAVAPVPLAPEERASQPEQVALSPAVTAAVAPRPGKASPSAKPAHRKEPR